MAISSSSATLQLSPLSNSTISSKPKPSIVSLHSNNVLKFQTLKSTHSSRVLAASEALDTPQETNISSYVEAEKIQKQKIRIKLRSYWVSLIEDTSKQIMDAARMTNAKTIGPVPLPTRKRVFCVLKSPHVHKDARFHFEIRTHQRLIDIYPTAETIDALMQLQLPAGVDVEIKL